LKDPAPPHEDATKTPLIRAATPQDLESLVEFNVRMAEETESRRLEAAILRLGVSAVLSDPSHGSYIVALRRDRVVGALLVTYEWSDWRNGRFWWIQSVYVIPEERGSGVYTGLHRFASDQARRDPSACGLRLYVARSNAIAQATYQKLGMHETDYLMYEEEF